MRKKHTAQSAFLSLCISLGVLAFFAGILVVHFASVSPETSTHDGARRIEAQAQRGYRTHVAPTGNGVYEAWVAGYNGTGNGYDEAKSVAVDNSGNVYVAGTIWGSRTLNDYATIKYNSVRQQQSAALYNDFEGPDNQLNAMTIAQQSVQHRMAHDVRRQKWYGQL